MFSQTAEYALRAAVWLAEHPERPQTTIEIAAGMSIPQLYLAKVMGLMVCNGILKSQRGRTGGFVLERPPSEISVYEIVDAVDPLHRIEECPLSLPQHAKKLCPLHAKMDRSLAAIEKDLKSSCLAELSERPKTLVAVAGDK